MADPLPEFDKPPVSEVAISIQFSPLPNWRGPYAGLFWGFVKSDYPKTKVLPPLPFNADNFDELVFQSQAVNFQAMDADSQRYWFLNEPETELIQLQRDRFVINWKQVKGAEIYPRYDLKMRPRLIKEWQRFRGFLKANDLGEPQSIQCELVYINDFVQGIGWNTFAEAMSLLSNWVPKGSINFLPALETLNLNGTIRMPEGRGRFFFTVQHVLRQTDGKQAVQLRLTARGNPKSDRDDELMKWLDFSRDWIVRGFTDLTSPAAHKLWHRKR